MKPLNIKKIKAILKAFEKATFIDIVNDDRAWVVGWTMETKGLEHLDIPLLLHDEQNDNDCLNFYMIDISNAIVSKNIIAMTDTNGKIDWTIRLWKRSPLNING